jgi:hypothetical protein
MAHKSPRGNLRGMHISREPKRWTEISGRGGRLFKESRGVFHWRFRCDYSLAKQCLASPWRSDTVEAMNELTPQIHNESVQDPELAMAGPVAYEGSGEMAEREKIMRAFRECEANGPDYYRILMELHRTRGFRKVDQH